MTLPDVDAIRIPVLRALEDGAEHSTEDIRTSVAGQLQVSEADQQKPTPGGEQVWFVNRVAHVLARPKGQFVRVRDGVYRITDFGRVALGFEPGTQVQSLGGERVWCIRAGQEGQYEQLALSRVSR